MEKGGVDMPNSRTLVFRLVSGRPAAWTAVFLAVLMLVLIPLDYYGAAADLQLRQASQTAVKPGSLSRAFSLSGVGSQAVEIEVKAAGRIEARAEWTGSAATLALILNGPGRVNYYARKDGKSPLTLTFEVTADLLALGSAWKLSVSNFGQQAQAQGTVRVTYPGAAQQAQASGRAAATTGAKTGTQAAGTKASAQTSTSKTEQARQATTEQARAAGTTAVKQKPAGTAVAKTGAQAALKPQRPPLSAETARGLAEYEIAEAVRRDPAAAIILPLMIQGVEESWAGQSARLRAKTSALTASSAAVASGFQKSRLSPAASGRLQTSVSVLGSIPQDFRQRHFHPRYANLRPGQSVDLKQLGLDILAVSRPGFQNELRSAANTALAGWKQRALAPLSQAPRAVGGALQTKTAAALAPKMSGAARAQVQSTVAAMQSSRSAAQRKDLQNSLAAQAKQMGFPVNEALTRGQVSAAVIEGMNQNRSADPNKFHKVLPYYRYQVRLDRLLCVNDNEWEDEPYLVVRTMTPQFEMADPSFTKDMLNGCLNRVDSWMTAAFSGVDPGEHRVFGPNDRWVLDALTYGSPTTFTFDLWEWDNTRGEVMDAAEQLALTVAYAVRDKLLEGVRTAILESLMTIVMEQFEQLAGAGLGELANLLSSVLGGTMNWASFLTGLDNLLKGNTADPLWCVLFLVFSGGDFLSLLSTVGFGSPIIGGILLALVFVWPVLEDVAESFFGDLFSGDLMDAIGDLLLLPFKIIVNFFTKLWTSIKDLVHMILALLDPDDFIGSQTVSIVHGYEQNAYQDAVVAGTEEPAWWGANVETISASEAARQNRAGYGPSRETSNLVTSRGDFVVPKLRFKVADAVIWEGMPFEKRFAGTEYLLYYNVKRELAAAREYFGYSLEGDGPDGSGFLGLENYQRYVSKGEPGSQGPGFRNRIRVFILTDTTAPPWVYIRQGSRSWWNRAGEFFFELESYPGETYEISVYKFGKGDMTGQLLFVETPPVDAGSIVCAPPPQPSQGGTGPGGPRKNRRTVAR
jgi:hypothetical protein